MWHFKVGFLEQGLVGEAADFSKQRAKQLASLRLLKMLFPEQATWNDICQMIPLHKGADLTCHLKPGFKAIYEQEHGETF